MPSLKIEEMRWRQRRRRRRFMRLSREGGCLGWRGLPPSHPNFRSNTVNGKVRRSGSGGGSFLSFPVLVSTSRGCCVAAKLCLGLLKSQLHDHRKRREETDGLVFSPIVVYHQIRDLRGCNGCKQRTHASLLSLTLERVNYTLD